MDHLTPFHLNEQPIRGRIVRLSDSVTHILNQHAYPDRISQLLAETLLMAAIMSSGLKGQGVFTVQLQSKGALSLLVVDATADGHLRGYAQFDEKAALTQPLSVLCPEGYLAITLDTGDASKRYQGIVPLEGESIAETMQHYFVQSQQLMVKCKLAAGKQTSDGQDRWIAGGIYIEHLPESAAASAASDAWHEASVLLETVRDDELLDTALPQEDLLYRLFHEGGVWAHEPIALEAKCRCNRDKVEHMLSQMSAQDLQDMADDGQIAVDCQFCGVQERFALDQMIGQ